MLGDGIMHSQTDRNSRGEIVVVVPRYRAGILRDALDFYGRICMGQMEELGTYIRLGHVLGRHCDRSDGVVISPSVSQAAEDIIGEIKLSIGHPRYGSWGVGGLGTPMAANRAYEVGKVLAKACFDFDGSEDSWRVDADGLLVRYTRDPKPVASVVDGLIRLDLNLSQAVVLHDALDFTARLRCGRLEEIVELAEADLLRAGMDSFHVLEGREAEALNAAERAALEAGIERLKAVIGAPDGKRPAPAELDAILTQQVMAGRDREVLTEFMLSRQQIGAAVSACLEANHNPVPDRFRHDPNLPPAKPEAETDPAMVAPPES